MTANELLKPRFEVIADYPNSNFKIGEVLYVLTDEESKHSQFKKEWFAKYPAIFKALQWYEHRDISEMPEYVKVNYVSSIWGVSYKVGDIIPARFRMESEDRLWMHTAEKPFNTMQLHHFTPATQSEFDNYLNSKK